MTEQQWLTAADPGPMLNWHASGAKRWLLFWLNLGTNRRTTRRILRFAGACCVRGYTEIEISSWDGELLQLVALGSGVIQIQDFEKCMWEIQPELEPIEVYAKWRAEEAARDRGIHLAWEEARGIAARDDRTEPISDPTAAQRYMTEESKAQAGLLRDILGNPFRHTTLDPRWLTSTVRGLAQCIYADRAFDRLPILLDAGCYNEALLSHCHSPEPHVRGCWVIDLLLGKE